MEIKKLYKINDPVWIHGFSKFNKKMTKGTVIHILDLTSAGYQLDFPHYVISIPTEIEPLLEIRTWETMSQDSTGPIGIFRDIPDNCGEHEKKIGHLGYYSYEDDEDDEPSPEEINAALDRSNAAFSHSPLLLKDPKPKKKYYNRKKKL